MNVILASIDSNLFDEASYVRKRILEYARLCERLEVVCVTTRAGAANIRLAHNVNVHVISGSKLLAPFRLFVRLLALIRSLGRAGTLISSQDPFFLGLVSLAAARAGRVPLHIQVHVAFGSPWYRKAGIVSQLRARIALFVLRSSDRIRTVSHVITEHCTQSLRISADRIDTIPLLIDINRIRAAEHTLVSSRTDTHALYPQYSHIVLIACRLTAQKNIPRALRAFVQVIRTLPDAGLVIVGRGEEEECIRALIEELGLVRSVALIPWSDDVPALMRSSDVFLISSDYEGYVMTAMEASASGLPIVMTDVGGAGEFVRHKENGLIVPVEDEAGLATALIRVLANPTLRKHLAVGGRRAASLLPSPEEYRVRIIESWEKTLVRCRKSDRQVV